jgi:hypothetical protein
LSTRPKTHTTVARATWPSVASTDERMQWIAAILENENIESQLVSDPMLNKAIVAIALLKDVATSSFAPKALRLAAFKAMIEAEEGTEAAVLD